MAQVFLNFVSEISKIPFLSIIIEKLGNESESGFHWNHAGAGSKNKEILSIVIDKKYVSQTKCKTPEELVRNAYQLFKSWEIKQENKTEEKKEDE